MEPTGDYSISRSGHLAMSIDRVGQCSNDPASFAEIALTHACRDLEAGFVKPTDALICYEFGPETNEVEQIEIVRSVKAAAEHRNISVGKCHSVLVDGTTSLVICVIGEQNRSAMILPKTGLVWLSHGLGAAKLQYMREIGTLAGPYPALKQMTLPVQTDVLSNQPSVVADVSGHGLAGSLIDLAERYGVSIDVTILPALALSEEVLAEEISLFENDRSSYGDIIDVANDAWRLAALKETAGPLVALTGLVDTNIGNSITNAGWFRIGQYEQGESGVRIRWGG
jgi:thiamine monophosphate kinase